MEREILKNNSGNSHEKNNLIVSGNNVLSPVLVCNSRNDVVPVELSKSKSALHLILLVVKSKVYLSLA
jgi:hypothetical protein